MTSQVTREEVITALYLAGLKDPRKVARVMQVVESYVWARLQNARPFPEAEEKEKLYKCTGKGMCNKEKPLEEFPERKQLDPSLRVPCAYCDARRVSVRDAR